MQHNWSHFSSLQCEKYAAHFVKMNFIAANCAIYEDTGGSRGVTFVVKNEKGQYVDIYLATVYIEKPIPDELFTDSISHSRIKPSWGINISRNTIPRLAEKYWFENIMLNKKP